MEPQDEELRMAVIEYFKEKYRLNPAQDHSSGEVAVKIHSEHPTYVLQRLEAAIIFLYDMGKLSKRTLPRGDTYYRLSGEMVNEISPSQYAQHPISPITINNYGVFVGGANYGQISQNTKEAFESIDKLINAISSAEAENTKKMELIANAEVIRAQLLSPSPDKVSIKKSWDILNSAVQFGAALQTISPFVIELAHKVEHIVTLLPH